jgi:hypothetical protein
MTDATKPGPGAAREKTIVSRTGCFVTAENAMRWNWRGGRGKNSKEASLICGTYGE